MEKDNRNRAVAAGVLAALLVLSILLGSMEFTAPFIYGILFLYVAVAAGGLWFLLRQLQRQKAFREEESHIQEKAHAENLQRERMRLEEIHRREMADFAHALSHSLRMPAAIIQGYAELLAGDMVTDEETRQQYLKKIIQRSQYITETMSQHFASRQVSDRIRLSCQRIDLLELVYQAASDMQTAAREQEIVIHVISMEDRLPMWADGYFLNRVLFNLLENSLKYMGRAGTIVIRVMKEENQVQLVVQDDGMGVSEDAVAHIFEPAYQGSNRVSGQGYGLHLVRQTVEAHGGTVFARSEPGKGMGIFITLPLEQAAENGG